MFVFDTRRPTSLDAIDQYIGSYATPEAAEADTRRKAPQGLDYLTRNYQDLTGDAFADPFEDASNARARAMTEAAMNGASVAVGGNMGMRLLSLPKVGAPLPVQADHTVANANAKHTAPGPAPTLPSGSSLLSPLGNREVAKSSMLQMLQSGGNAYRMASNEMQIPDPSEGNFLDVLEKRSAAAGASDEFRKIQRENPNALRYPPTDPRLARGPSGKAISRELHPLATDETFQQLMRQDPEKGKALYQAITNSDYKTDIEAKTAAIVEQRDARKKIIEGIKGLEADPVTGELFKIVERTDWDGSIKQNRVPITPLDKAAIEAEGGAKRIYGVDLPNIGGLKKIPGTTPQEHSAYISRTQELIKKHPDMKVEDASKLAHRQLYEEQRDKAAPKPSRMVEMLTKTGEGLTDAQIAGTNLIPKFLNYMLTRGQYTGAENDGVGAPLPLIPHPNWNELKKENVGLQDMLTEGVKYWRPKLAGPF